MTLQDLIDIMDAEGISASDAKLVMNIGGTVLDVYTCEGEGLDPNDVYLTVAPREHVESIHPSRFLLSGLPNIDSARAQDRNAS